MVSIPFRYAENGKSQCVSRLDGKFQFLLGTLKTDYITGLIAAWYRFQFLLGTLKTTLNFGTLGGVMRFNSF